MKLEFVLIGVLLLVSTAACNSNEDNGQLEFIDKLNALRREFAKNNNIVNMHELSFDQNLMNEAKTRDSTGQFVNYRYTYIEKFSDGVNKLLNSSTSFEQKSEQEKMEAIDNATTIEDLSFEHLTPGHTKIGCTKYTTGKILCLLAPDGNLSSWFKEAGDAGSLCMSGYKNVNGLCSITPKTSISIPQNHKTPPVPTTSESELDRQIAKYKNEEQDGDEYDEDFPTTIIASSAILVSPVMTVVFVVLVSI
ncbi:unnamed protein product [Caenorhabditis brenneri]